MFGAKATTFFDTRAIERGVERAQARALRHGGAYIRTVARRSIKRVGAASLRKGEVLDRSSSAGKRHRRIAAEIDTRPTSRPGQPPYTHTGFIKQDILYAYDPHRGSVAVGPSRLPWLNELLETGGTAPRQLWKHLPSGKLYLFKKRRPKGRLWQFVRTVQAVYRARPFMEPARRNSETAVTRFWQDAVRAGL